VCDVDSDEEPAHNGITCMEGEACADVPIENVELSFPNETQAVAQEGGEGCSTC